MKKYILTGSILFLFFNCSNNIDYRLNRVVNNYIKEAQLKDEAYISVDKIDFDSLYVFRINAKLTFDEEKLPYQVGEISDHYVLKYQIGQEVVDLKDIPEEVKFIEKYRPGALFYNPPFWLTIACKNGERYKVFKDPLIEEPPPTEKENSTVIQHWWKAPLNSIQQITDISNLKLISDIKCNSK